MTITTDLSAPLFTVVGATGAQGGSTVRAIRASTKPYRVRAITRDSSKPQAKDLENLGCQVVQANVDTKSDAEKAFTGSDVVFAMTLSDYDSTANEFQKGQVQVDAAKTQGVKTFIWSGEPHLGKISGGKMEVPLFDVKAEIADYARSVGLNIIEIWPGGFASGFIERFIPRKQPDGSYLLSMPLNPDTKFPVIDIASDFGKYVVDAFEKGRKAPILAAPEYITLTRIAEVFSEVSGQKVSFTRADDEAYRATLAKFAGEGLAANVVNMNVAYRTIGYYGQQDLTDSNAILSTPARKFPEFLHAHKAEVLRTMDL